MSVNYINIESLKKEKGGDKEIVGMNSRQDNMEGNFRLRNRPQGKKDGI